MSKIYCKNLQITIDDNLKKEIKAEAARRGVTLTEFVEGILKEALNGKPTKAK